MCPMWSLHPIHRMYCMQVMHCTGYISVRHLKGKMYLQKCRRRWSILGRCDGYNCRRIGVCPCSKYKGEKRFLFCEARQERSKKGNTYSGSYESHMLHSVASTLGTQKQRRQHLQWFLWVTYSTQCGLGFRNRGLGSTKVSLGSRQCGLMFRNRSLRSTKVSLRSKQCGLRFRNRGLRSTKISLRSRQCGLGLRNRSLGSTKISLRSRQYA